MFCLTLVLAILTTSLGNPNPITVTTINQGSGIYFEEIGRVELYSSEWRIAVFYDLEALKTALLYLSRHVDEANHLCGATSHDSHFATTCNSIVHEMDHLMQEIRNKYELLKPHYKQKRSPFDAIGMVSKALFGTLNEEDARFYDNQINKLQKNQEHLSSLLTKQTLIIETTANILNKTQHSLNDQISALHAKFQRIKTMTEELVSANQNQQIAIELETVVSLSTLIMMRLHDVINSMIDLITDARQGKPHPSIVTPTQLEVILNTIRKGISNDKKLPTILSDNNLLALYRISQMSASIVNNRIIYELRIPLPYKDNYQLYKIIPLPTEFHGKFVIIQPTMNFLVIDYNKEHYYDMLPEELASCITEDHSLYLCRMIHPIFMVNTNKKSCELQLIRRENTFPSSCDIRTSNHTNIWIQMSQVNKWLFSTLKNLTIDTICQDAISPYVLSGTGIIEVSGGCYLRTPDLTIRGYETKATKIRNFYIPPLNLSSFLNKSMVTYKEFTNKAALIRYTASEDLAKLSKQIVSLKEEQKDKLEPLDGHTIHHYTISYFLLLIIIVIVAYNFYKKSNCKDRAKTNTESIYSEVKREDKKLDDNAAIFVLQQK